MLDSRITRRLRRNHLSEEVNDIEYHKREDVKKERELRELHRKIEEKDGLVKELMLELEERRLRGIELTTEENEHEAKQKQLEKELHQLREELALRQDENGVDNDVHLNDQTSEDSFMLVDPADIDISTEDMTPRTYHADSSPLQSKVLSSSPPTSVHDPTYESEIHKLGESITSLNSDLANAKSALLVLSNELQGLGFTSTDATPKDVIAAVRLAFHTARVDMEGLIPDQDPGQYNNGEFLQLLVSNIRGLMEKVDEQLQLISGQQEMEAILHSQNSGILDKFAQVDARKTKLEATNLQLDMEIDNRERKVVELEDTIVGLEAKVSEQGMTITNHDQRIFELESEREENQISLDRLKDALESYRRDLADTERLLERTQKEHEDAVVQLERNRDSAIADMASQLEEVKTSRQSVDQRLSDQRMHFHEIQEQISTTENELAQLKEQLLQSQIQAETEHSQREQAEATVKEKNEFIASLEWKVSSLEESLEELRNDLDRLRVALTIERQQRESAEAELDSRHDEVMELEKKLNEAGIEANELRMKLFEVQESQIREIAELRDSAAVREEQLKNDLATKSSQHEDTENTVVARDQAIAILDQKIIHADAKIRELQSSKDELQSVYEQETAHLNVLLKEANDAYAACEQEKDSEISGLRTSIAALNATLEEHTSMIQRLESQISELTALRSAENEEHQVHTSDLEDDLRIAKERIEHLEQQRASLEERVEEEAVHMLDCQEKVAERTGMLENTLRTREKNVRLLKQMVKEQDMRYNEVVEGKDREIESLRIVSEARKVDINRLVEQVKRLREKHCAVVESGRAAIARVAADARVEEETFVEAGRKGLEEVDAMADVYVCSASLTPSISNGEFAVVANERKPRLVDSDVGEDGVVGNEMKIEIYGK
jgi:myosin protein heavy chain